MKIVVTGATGFVGQHVVRHLRDRCRWELVAVAQDEARLRALEVPWVAMDVNANHPDVFERLGRPHVVLHLAWDDLHQYNGLHHIEGNLFGGWRFLRRMVEGGAERVACAGTCYEYGLQDGCLDEAMPTQPVSAYGVAKDALRRFLERLQASRPFALRWLRLFFLYGPGQNPRALLPLLDRALDRGDATFDMSGGEQLRDYLPVETVAEAIVKATFQNRVEGAINICSGQPVSVRSLVEGRIRERGSSIVLNLGAYPYPAHEPLAFWGNPRKMNMALDAFDEGDSLAC